MEPSIRSSNPLSNVAGLPKCQWPKFVSSQSCHLDRFRIARCHLAYHLDEREEGASAA